MSLGCSLRLPPALPFSTTRRFTRSRRVTISAQLDENDDNKLKKKVVVVGSATSVLESGNEIGIPTRIFSARIFSALLMSWISNPSLTGLSLRNIRKMDWRLNFQYLKTFLGCQLRWEPYTIHSNRL